MICEENLRITAAGGSLSEQGSLSKWKMWICISEGNVGMTAAAGDSLSERRSRSKWKVCLRISK